MKSTKHIQTLLSCGIALTATFGFTSAKDLNPAFGTDLYQQLRTDEGNVFFSPYSISQAMGMVYVGSGGNTSTEIAKALSFSQNTKILGSHMHVHRQTMMEVNQKDNKLNIANALCVTGKSPLQGYQDTVRQQYDGEIFSGGLGEINGWVKKKTEGNIEKILEELSPDSICVLLNAVYFKGNWKTSFETKKTHKADFHLPSGKTAQVDMMHREDNFKVLRDKGMIAVELPYQTSPRMISLRQGPDIETLELPSLTSASMVLIMPEKADGMKALEDSLNQETIQTLCKNLQGAKDENADLFLPKFKIATSYDLVEPMKQLGMADAFDMKKADFKVMYGETPVKISQIKHKATLEVDEMGSVASAVTAVEMQTEKGRVSSPQIRFDRPFLLLIRENTTGTNLFMGRINNPAAK